MKQILFENVTNNEDFLTKEFSSQYIIIYKRNYCSSSKYYNLHLNNFQRNNKIVIVISRYKLLNSYFSSIWQFTLRMIFYSMFIYYPRTPSFVPVSFKIVIDTWRTRGSTVKRPTMHIFHAASSRCFIY